LKLKPIKLFAVKAPKSIIDGEGTDLFPIEEFEAPEVDKVRRLRLDKDGTYYDVIGFHCPKGVACGMICQSESGWLVVNGLNDTAFFFRDRGYYAWDYVAEKVGRGTIEMTQRDVENFLLLVDVLRGVKNAEETTESTIQQLK